MVAPMLPLVADLMSARYCRVAPLANEDAVPDHASGPAAVFLANTAAASRPAEERPCDSGVPVGQSFPGNCA